MSVVLASVRNDAQYSIEDTLKLVGRLLRDTEQKTAAVVDAANHERVNKCSDGVVASSRERRM